MSIFSSGRSKHAYQGNLNCPLCQSAAIRFVENVVPCRDRYRCRKCGISFQYDYSNREDINPYAPLMGGSFERDLKRFTQGRKLKGAFK